MRKLLFSLTLLALIAGSADIALAQGLPTTQPKFLHIFREQVKAGRGADHAKWEAGWPAAFEKAKCPDNYIALASVTGPNEVLYVMPFASQAAFGESLAAETANPVLSAELERLGRGDAEFVSDQTAIEAVARPDLSHGEYPDMATMRFWEITTFRVKPGHGEDFARTAKAYAAAAARSAPNARWRTYEVVAGAPGGTYLVFGSVGSFADFDKAMAEDEALVKGLSFDERSTFQKFDAEAAISAVTNRYRLDPARATCPPRRARRTPPSGCRRSRRRRRPRPRSRDPSCGEGAPAPGRARPRPRLGRVPLPPGQRLGEVVGRLHQRAEDPGLLDAVAGVGDDHELRLRPALVQLPGARGRADHVVATLHDHPRQVRDLRGVVEELGVAAQPGPVNEVVRLDPREGVGELVAAEVGDVVGVDTELAGRALPDRPGLARPRCAPPDRAR